MRMYDIIMKKRNGGELTEEEIRFFIEGYTKGEIPDYQVSSLMMAIYFRKMTDKETLYLTMAMAESGDKLDLSAIKGIKVDKHSTGGVGDKTSLALTPMVSACGVPVAKMSGRGLGHTGGTIDKLESFPGFSTGISNETFIKNVNNIGIAIMGQTADLAPADKKLYALRDVTATVDNMSLIASSIMSKKLALGADCILLDVKYGNGAFMKTPESAAELAEIMVSVGKLAGKKCRAVITDMNAPLGHAVGNALEVSEVIGILQNNDENALSELALALSAHMLELSGKGDFQTCLKLASGAVTSGKALEKFAAMIAAQGGDASVTEDTARLPKAKIKKTFKAEKSGYISGIHSEQVGLACLELGAGKTASRSEIDYSAGVVFLHDVGDSVSAGEILGVIHGSSESLCEQAEQRLLQAVRIADEKPEISPLIHQIIS